MSTIAEYLEGLKGKSVAVIGMGVSNTPLIRMLLRAGVKVTVCDKSPRERVEELVSELESLGARFQLGPDYLSKLYRFDIIFRTPGLSPNTPELQQAAEKGREITSEMELFFQLCPCKIIGVTGSDGKTTTTTLISEFLREAGRNVYLGGNIGRPLLPDVASMEPEDVVVVELSSFQLMTMKKSPNVAVFTNLSPNHLDYHHTMEEYTAAKLNIFTHQGKNDRAVFNFDNDITRSLSKQAPGQVMLFSRKKPLEEGVYLRDDTIWLTNEMGSREVLPLSMIQIPGVHNIENYMAAIAAVDGLVPDKCVRAVAQRFTGVEHRIELVRELDGVKYYNDSIGTSPTRTMACLDSFDQKLILIAGGYDKGVPFTQLGVEITKKVKFLILTGATAEAIKASVEQAPEYAEHTPDILVTDNLSQAVDAARTAAVAGDVVVLSPACAAFDKFKNFMERGKVFKDLVNAL
ncbi:UDP-N-acetylmuramoyl-L-alanine--D-glutamate ligase [Pseudoflavonifractor sp. AF19-9AC]|uniref:UDP-N-acetylmuramoyl-L-alanine--D-glutamate ligase n=1 Tax=Pseudoflavonifractor sp. AF19-9AC TaxID=2292244 RepID=UPI000E47CB96|nr:UDP-N-acetylmuramoyl-L-alanine--D-glutamate ligase [Pseudoflavonifractor sp. AF19-9AC]RHR08981.1 UDP-N-acetylmuramoyl-L-alanine--D-glutamate ligase [Pseudoflavonifractor sp. AF19-9AC]